MISPTHKTLAGLVIAAACSPVLHGQSYVRDRNCVKMTPYIEVVSGFEFVQGSIKVPSNYSANPSVMEWTYDPSGTGGTTAQGTLPFHRIGAVVRVGNGQFVATGLYHDSAGARKGVICKLNLNTAGPSISVVESVQYDGFDPLRIAWNSAENRLYVMDYSGSRVLVAPWTGWGAALPVASSFGTSADKNLVPALFESWRLEIEPANPGAAFDDPTLLIADGMDDLEDPLGLSADAHRGVRIRGIPISPFPDAYTRLVEMSSVWSLVVDEESILHPGTLRHYFHPTSPAPDGANVFILTMKGPGSLPFDICDEWGSVLTSGVVPGQGLPKSVGPIPQISDFPGMWCFIKSSDPECLVNDGFRTFLRYGSPSVSDEIHLGACRLPLIGPYLDNPDFGVGSTISKGVNFGTGISIYCELWIATRGPTGIDPVQNIGGKMMLIPEFTVPMTLDAVNLAPDVGVHIPIPNDPLLHGNVQLFQFACLTGSGAVVCTDIVGATIDAWSDHLLPGPGAQASSGFWTKSTSATRQIPSRNSVSRHSTWMTQNPTIDEAKTSRILRLLK